MLDGSFMEISLYMSMESKLNFLPSDICFGSSGVCVTFKKEESGYM